MLMEYVFPDLAGEGCEILTEVFLFFPSSSSLPDLKRSGQRRIQPPAADRNRHRRTLTESFRSWWAAPDLNASSRSQWALPGLNRQLPIPLCIAGSPQLPAPDPSGHHQLPIPAGMAGPQLPAPVPSGHRQLPIPDCIAGPQPPAPGCSGHCRTQPPQRTISQLDRQNTR